MMNPSEMKKKDKTKKKNTKQKKLNLLEKILFSLSISFV